MKILLVVLFAAHVCAFKYLKSELPIEERIHGGEDAGEHEFPTQTTLMDVTNPSCGGSILSEWFILTAAHCVISKQTFWLKVVVGSANFTAGRIIPVSKFIIHEGYVKEARKDDIALIKLAEPLVLDGVTVKAAVLPEQDEKPTSTKATLIGMGYTDAFGSIPTILQKMTTDLTECHLEKLFSDLKVLCVTQGIQKGICHGDSGSPMIVDGKVVGVTHGFLDMPCFKQPTRVAYTDVSSYRSWIDQKMKTE